MYRNVKFVAAMLVGALAAPSLAMSQTAIVTTDLNLRIGPGSGYQIITAMPAGYPILVEECLEPLGWCRVSFGGYTGWAYGAYLAFETGGEQVIIAEPAPPVGVTVAAIAPPAPVLTYVRQAPIEPVFIEREVVIGTILPEYVILNPVPEYDYRFAYVNHHRVLVDPVTRRVVYAAG